MGENFFKTRIGYENWKSKYQYNDESPLGTFKRIAKVLASKEKNPEQWEDVFLKTLLKFNGSEPIGIKCSTGGRITSNIGTEYNGATLINCFISGPVKNAKIQYTRKNDNFENTTKIKTPDTGDDLINIFLTVLEQAKTLASEGGWGINFDFIRPRGSLIKGTGVGHPGVVSYMKIFDSVSECIVKGHDDGYVDTLKNYLSKKEMDECIDVINKMPRKGAMMGVLSCFSKNTLILTDSGWRNIVDIVDDVISGKQIKCVSDTGELNLIYDAFEKEPEQIFEVETEDGSIIEVTQDHKFEVRNITTGEIYLKAIKDIDVENEELKIIISE
ncbi:MAG: hypothetical protein WC260_01680 [Candidatus Pacearchaeota archaeon]